MSQLKHYGVPGMHWGQRSTAVRGTSIHSQKTLDKKTKESVSKSLSMKIKNMDPQKIEKGKKIVGGILKTGLGLALLASLPKITRLTNKVLIDLTPA